MPEVQSRKVEKAIDKQRPFLGLRSFEEKNKSQFGGRDEEIKELYGLDENSVLTVVFGKSGIGKTSLIKAGLIPELRQNFYFPIYARIDYSSSRTPLEQIRKIVFEEMKKKDPGVPEFGDRTLWEYFHNVNLLDDLVTPVLILDQFEEIFTLGEGKENVSELLVQLADLAENRIPLTVQSEYQKLNKTVPTHYAEQPYRVLLSLREDYLARLEELKKYMPSIMNSRFRVVQMTIGQALEAAVKPGRGLIDEKVALEIIKKLPGISLQDFDPLDQKGSGQKNLKVEPFLLSLVCDRLNEKRIEKGLKKITAALVSKFNVTDVIYSFYTETITPFGENVEQAIEDCLLTEGGFRKLQALEEFQRLYDISDEVVDQLVDARILRKEIRDGVDYAELIHDVLAPIIKGKRSKRARKAREEERQAAIVLAKKKQRSKLIRITSMVGIAIGLVLATTSYFALENGSLLDKQLDHNAKMQLANDLILTSERTSSVESNPEKGALIARLAYLIYKNNKNLDGSEDMYQTNFYNAMYTALNYKGYVFIENILDTVVQSIFRTGAKEIYIGLKEDGMIDVEPLNSDFDEKSILFNLENVNDITMDVYQGGGRNLLAISGFPDSLFINDIDAGETVKKIAVRDVHQSSRPISFTDDGGLIMLQNGCMLRWDSSYEELTRINFSEDTKITAIKHNPIKDSLIVGNIRGEVFTVSVNGEINKSNKHMGHTKGVSGITFSPDEKWIASVADDNMIVIWNSKNWNALTIRANTILKTDFGFPLSVTFTPESDYVLVGYEYGTILKWPVSLDVIARLICEDVKAILTYDEWKDYVGKEGTNMNKEEYDCE